MTIDDGHLPKDMNLVGKCEQCGKCSVDDKSCNKADLWVCLTQLVKFRRKMASGALVECAVPWNGFVLCHRLKSKQNLPHCFCALFLSCSTQIILSNECANVLLNFKILWNRKNQCMCTHCIHFGSCKQPKHTLGKLMFFYFDWKAQICFCVRKKLFNLDFHCVKLCFLHFCMMLSNPIWNQHELSHREMTFSAVFNKIFGTHCNIPGVTCAFLKIKVQHCPIDEAHVICVQSNRTSLFWPIVAWKRPTPDLFLLLNTRPHLCKWLMTALDCTRDERSSCVPGHSYQATLAS